MVQNNALFIYKGAKIAVFATKYKNIFMNVKECKTVSTLGIFTLFRYMCKFDFIIMFNYG